jgi:hypothetical protein
MTTIDPERTMYCGGCGAAVDSGTTFCGACGRAVEIAAATEPAIAPVAAPVTATAPEWMQAPSSSGVERNRRSRNLGILIAVVLIVLSLLGRYIYAVATTKPDRGDVIASFKVDEAGGRFKFDRVGEIRVPKGALAIPITIRVRRSIPNKQVRINTANGGTAILPAGTFPVYDFEPKSVEFLKQVMLILPSPPGSTEDLLFTVIEGKIRFFKGHYENGKVSIKVSSLDLSKETEGSA